PQGHRDPRWYRGGGVLCQIGCTPAEEGLIVIGLLDLKNAYCSMEAVFDPSIRGRPVIVASNGDGCVVARSAEAKALGVGMGQAIHEIDAKVRRQLVVRSANFTLYGSLSNRV